MVYALQLIKLDFDFFFAKTLIPISKYIKLDSEAYFGSCQLSLINVFFEKGSGKKAFNTFCKKSISQMFGRALNTPLVSPTLQKHKSSLPEALIKKCFIENFTKFTRKHLPQACNFVAFQQHFCYRLFILPKKDYFACSGKFLQMSIQGQCTIIQKSSINPFYVISLFLCPLKISENQRLLYILSLFIVLVF